MEIGVIDANDQSVEAELSGSVFLLQLSWNSAAAFWTVKAQDAERPQDWGRFKLTLGDFILRQSRRGWMPPGDLWVDAPTLPRLARDSFASGAARLFYVTAADLEN